jgi:hypothetical protein
MNGTILVHTKDIFDPRMTPAFRKTQPADIPVASLDPTKIAQTQSLTRMKKSYDEAQRQIQAASYDQLGQRLQRHEQAALIDLVVY